MTWIKQHLDHLLATGLFLVALLPRALDLGAFATVDEAKWVYRSAQFLAALLLGDLGGTAVNLTPAVTTTWLGALGLTAYHALGGAPGVSLADWLRTLPEFRAEIDVLVAVRWPMVLFGALAVSGLYALARRLVGWQLALATALLLALDPQMIALTRVLGHDAPAGLFTGLALLAFLVALQQPAHRGWLRWMAVSGALAGLALLSKSPAFFLVPFVGAATLITALAPPLRFARGQGGEVTPITLPRTTHAVPALAGLPVWAVVAWLVFVALWPAAWLRPIAAPYDVVHNAFLSATDSVEAVAEGFWQVPDLGILYYPINGLFKLSPLATLGLAVWLGSLASQRRPHPLHGMEPHSLAPSPLRGEGDSPLSARRRGVGGEIGRAVDWYLLAFVILFTVFMTLGGKRSNRYLLPAWPALYLLAGLGLARLATLLPALRVARGARLATAGLLAILLVLPAVASHPYYLSYFNPLAGGGLTAPRLVKIGWGEGLDRVGQWLQAHPDAAALRVGAPYPSALSPFFSGRQSGVTASQLDHVVTYIKQTQEGDPSPAWLRYFLAEPPLAVVRLAGIEYARIYAGPSMQPAMANEAAFDTGILPKPLFFRPDRPFAAIGEPLAVTVLWLADAELPVAPTHLTLQPAADLTDLPERRPGTLWADARATLGRRPDGLVTSRYVLQLPPDLPRGQHSLLVDGRPLGAIDARLFQPPPLATRLDATFGDQVRLMGVMESGPLTKGAMLRLVWQAAPRAWADYTVFLHLLNANGQRVAGLDVQPPVPTSDWARGEVVVMTYAPNIDRALPVPPDLPPGEYRLAVGLYAPISGERLPVRDAAGNPSGDSVLLPLAVTTEIK
jgi:4-amino-4-deoxy-L-arabinose transferase-like glycosyltransferase